MGYLGVNVASRGEYDPQAVKDITLAQFVRFVGLPDYNARGYVDRCRSVGISVVLVLARESFGDAGVSADIIDEYYQRHGNAVFYEIGNEPDHVSESSWTMSPADFSWLLATARDVMPSAYLISGGCVSGNPFWLEDVVLDPCNAVGVHPYAKEPWSVELDTMLAGYSAYGRPLWMTEYHARTLGLAQYFRDDARVQGSLAFCYSDAMVPGFGMLEDAAALNDFRTAVSSAPAPP